MGRNKERKQFKKAQKAAAAEAARAANPPVDDAILEDAPAIEPEADSVSLDAPELPSLYQAKLNPGGGLSIGDVPTGYDEGVHKKRRRNKKVEVEDEEEAQFAPIPADSEKGSKKNKTAADIKLAGLEPLYTPWELLDPSVRKAVESRLKKTFWEKNAAPIVFNSNQNISSGVNRLKTWLGVSESNAFPKPASGALESKNVVVSVSAQGNATNKLISIVELTKRLVKPSDETPASANGGAQETPQTWHIYTSLSSRTVEREHVPSRKEITDLKEYLSDVEDVNKDFYRKLSKYQKTAKVRRALKRKAAAGANKPSVGEDVDMAGNDTGAVLPASTEEAEDNTFEDLDKEGVEADTKMTTVPVLTIWISKQPIPEFRDAFGEQTFDAVKDLPQPPKENKGIGKRKAGVEVEMEDAEEPAQAPTVAAAA